MIAFGQVLISFDDHAAIKKFCSVLLHEHRNAPILVVATGHTGLLEPTCSSLAAAGFHQIHALSGMPNRALGWSHRLKSFTVLPAGLDEDACRRSILEAARSVSAKVLLPVATADVRMLSAWRGQFPAEILCVPVPAVEQLDELTDKLRFSRFMESIGYPTPRTLDAGAGLDAAAVGAELGFPLIAKPRLGGGGAGIRRIETHEQLRAFLISTPELPPYLLQELVPGEDVALTMLCEAGSVFAIAIRRRWLHQPGTNPFGPWSNMEFIHCDWLEEMGRSWVRRTEFSGVADFDLHVDFATRRFWFLECDPRMMASQRACDTFGVNMAALLCQRALGGARECTRAESGRFLSLSSLGLWLRQGDWNHLSDPPPVRMGWRGLLADPLPRLARKFGLA